MNGNAAACRVFAAANASAAGITGSARRDGSAGDADGSACAVRTAADSRAAAFAFRAYRTAGDVDRTEASLAVAKTAGADGCTADARRGHFAAVDGNHAAIRVRAGADARAAAGAIGCNEAALDDDVAAL